VIAHQEREASLRQGLTRGQHRDAVLFVPPIVDVELEREPGQRMPLHDRAHVVRLIADDDVRFGDAGAPRRRQRADDQRDTEKTGQEFRFVRAVVETVSVPSGQHHRSSNLVVVGCQRRPRVEGPVATRKR
jgi:hypothetical protein